MMAMTMPFTVRGTNKLEKVKAGDGVRFRDGHGRPTVG